MKLVFYIKGKTKIKDVEENIWNLGRASNMGLENVT